MGMAKKQLSKRERILLEVVDTERSFVTSIRTAIAVFVTPWIESDRTLEAIGDNALAALLKELALIESFGRTLLKELEDEMAGACRMGKVFKDFGPFLKMFANYLTLYDQWSSKSGLSEDASHFAQFIKHGELDTRCNGLSLNSFLIMPVQRVPRYRLLLEELLKETQPSHPDYDDLHAALALVSQAAKTNNARMARTESASYDALTQLQLKLFDPRGELNLLDWPARKLELGPTEMKKLCRKGPKVFTFWLVSDKILYAQRLSTTGLTAQFQLNRQIALEECVVRDTAFSTLSQRTTQRAAKLLSETAEVLPRDRSQCFQILSAKKSFVVEAPSVKLANEWRAAIARLQPAARKRSTMQSSSAEASVAPIWTPDKAVKACQKCAEPFTVLRRRHHCRICGKCFCADCSKYSTVIPRLDATKKQRVCFSCFNRPDTVQAKDSQRFRMPSKTSTSAWHVPASNPFSSAAAAAAPEKDQDNDDTDEEDEDDDDYSPPKRPPPVAPQSTTESPQSTAESPPSRDRPFNPFLKPPARGRHHPPPPPKTAPAVTRQSPDEQSPYDKVANDSRCKTAPPALPFRSNPASVDGKSSRPYSQSTFDASQRPAVEPPAHILNQPKDPRISEPNLLGQKSAPAWSCELQAEPKRPPPQPLQQWPRVAASTFDTQAPIAASPAQTEAAPQRPPPQPPNPFSTTTINLGAEAQRAAPPVWVKVSREASTKTLAERWAIVVASRSETRAEVHSTKPAPRMDQSADEVSQKSTIKQRWPPFAAGDTKAEPQHMLRPAFQTNHTVLLQASTNAISKHPWHRPDAPEHRNTPQQQPDLAGLRRAPRWPPPTPQPEELAPKDSSSFEQVDSRTICGGEGVRREAPHALPIQSQSVLSVCMQTPSPPAIQQQFVPASSIEVHDSAKEHQSRTTQRRAPRWPPPPPRSANKDTLTALDRSEQVETLPSHDVHKVESASQHALLPSSQTERAMTVQAPSARVDQQPYQVFSSTDRQSSSQLLCSQPEPGRMPAWPPRQPSKAAPADTSERKKTLASAASMIVAQPTKEQPGYAETLTAAPISTKQQLVSSNESDHTAQQQPNQPEAQHTPKWLPSRDSNAAPTAPDRRERVEGATSNGLAQPQSSSRDALIRPPPPPPRNRQPLPQQGSSAQTSGIEKKAQACQKSETCFEVSVEQHTAQPGVSQASIVRDRMQIFSAAQRHQQPTVKMSRRNSNPETLRAPLNMAPPKRWTSVLPTAAESPAVIAARRAASTRQASDGDCEDDD